MKNYLTTAFVLTAMITVGASANAQIIDVIGDSTNSATNVGGNSNLGNGDFQSIASGTGGIPYANVPNWFHADGGESVNFGQTTGLAPNGNPQASATPNYGAFQFNGRLNINDTSYTPAAGDTFSFGTFFIPNGGGIAATDTLTATLFTSTAVVDGDVTRADLTAVASTVLPAGNTTAFITAPDFYTATGSEGALYLGLELQSGSGVFSRTDLVTLSVAPAAVPEPSAITLLGLMGMVGLVRRKRS